MKTLKKVLSEADKVTKNVFEGHFIKDKGKEIELHDAAILGLIEDMVGKASSMITLIENKKYNGVDAFARMIFENYTFLRYILEKNTERRGRSYIKSIKLKETLMFDAYVEQSLEGREIREFLGIPRDTFIKKFSKLSDSEYRESLENDYKTGINNQNVHANWYNENGKIKKFNNLCEYLRLEKEYTLIYKIFSNEVHAKDALKYFEFQENFVQVFRKQVDFELHTSLISTFLMEITRLIYKYYGMDEELKRYNNILRINFPYLKNKK